MPNDQILLTDLLYQFSESTKSIFELTSRLDERIKTLMEQSQNSDKKITQIMEGQNTVISRIIPLEARTKVEDKIDLKLENISLRLHDLENQMQVVKMQSQTHEAKWKGMVDAAFKVVLTFLAVWLTWKFGLK